MNSQPVVVGAFEAKTKLGALLERVGRGASFVITKHDRPVARLVGYEEGKAARRAEVLAQMRTLRSRYRLGGTGVRQLREEGRA
jgi:prevent-host-death family protein